MLYFDHNATSPTCDAAREAWLRIGREFIGNPSSPHRLGSRAEKVLGEARNELAGMLGIHDPEEIVWTSGATEANNMVLHHVAQSSEGEVWFSAVEHPCVLAAAARWIPRRWRMIPVTTSGVVDLEWLAREIRHARPALVSVMAANNETGILQPWRQVLELCREWDVPFHCDAAQWLGKLAASGLGACTYVTGCAHKFGGGPGVGFLKAHGPLQPLIVGGPQESGRRGGTENVAGAAACVAALRDRESRIRSESPSERARARERFESLIEKRIPGVTILGRDVDRLWNTSCLLMPAVDCRRRWVVRLDRHGFALSTGSACSSGREKPSHVIRAMGLDPGGDRILRASCGWETGEGDWDQLAEGLIRVAAEFGVA